MSGSFVPAWWCRGPHCQTLFPYLFRPAPRVPLRRERLELADGDFLDLDWAGEAAHTPIVVILHGLEGSSRSKYARGLLRAVQARGWRGVVLHFRGCSGEPNRLARGYHSGETGDLGQVLARLRAREPHTPLAVVGYSLGGNVLLKYLGERGRDTPLAAAAAVSVPYRLDHCADRLCRGWSQVYQYSLMRRMRASLTQKRRRVALPLPRLDAVPLRTFWDFDEHVTAPLHGFSGARDYYTRSSSHAYLRHVEIPTLLIHALDDPFMTPATAPTAGDVSAAIRLELYPRGGHVGFVSGGAPWRPRYWLEDRIPSFLAAALAAGNLDARHAAVDDWKLDPRP